MNPPNEFENCASARFYTQGGIALLIVAFLAALASWHMYPLFIDTYYHMGVIEGFSQAGGITTRAFWELAPGGRVHIYPPSLHVIGYFLSLIGISPRTYITLASAFFYALCLTTTWIWLRRIIGPRSALFALIFLCGPYSFFWTQAVFTAVAGVMVLAPLAFLALETEHFLACGVINFIAITMHPIGLFLPPALVINAFLRKKKIFAGLLAASLPVVLYGPWLAHIWANRAFLPESRTGGEITLSGPGGGANLGLFLLPFALIAIPPLIARRGPTLGLIGALLGFAVVFPMGFGGRFLAFNIHWPLACLAGCGLGELIQWLENRSVPLFRRSSVCTKHSSLLGLRQAVARLGEKCGLGELAQWLERHAPLRVSAQVFSFFVAGFALAAYPAITMQMGFMGGGPPGEPQGRSSSRGRLTEQLHAMLTNWQFSIQAAALPKLFDAHSNNATDQMMGPRPGGGRNARDRQSNTGPQTESRRNARPGRDAGPENDRDLRQDMGPRPGMGPGNMGGGRGRGGGPGMTGGMNNMLNRTGAEDFFSAIKENVLLGDVIHIDDPMGGSLINGVTGRWTSSGILRDVRSENARAKPEQCDFKVMLVGGMGPGGGGGPGMPGGRTSSQDPPSGFKQVFKNNYGLLYQNQTNVEHARRPLKPDVSLPLLAVVAFVGFLFILIDYLPIPYRRARPIAAAIGTIIIALCFLPLTSTAIGELRNLPSASQARWNDGPGFGPPGFGPPGFGPGQFLAQAFLREADVDRSGAVSIDECRNIADRWLKNMDANRNGCLELEEFSRGLQPLVEQLPGLNGNMPLPDGPPGFEPEVFFTRKIFSVCDSNSDGKLTREEIAGAIEKWFREWDNDSKGFLDAEPLGKGLDDLLVFLPTVVDFSLLPKNL